MFRDSAYYLGDDYIPAREGNPTGFNEDSVINHTNARLIWRMWSMTLPRRLRLPQPAVHRDIRALWIARPFLRLFRGLPAQDHADMLARFARQPFCFKDPRFSITLPFWRQYLPKNTKFIVVFRDPVRTAGSMIREAERYTPPLQLSEDWCVKHWKTIYQWILSDSRRERDKWHFVYFDDVISGQAVVPLETFTNTKLNASAVDSRITRERWDGSIPASCRSVWDRLIEESQRDLGRYPTQIPAPAPAKEWRSGALAEAVR